MSDEFEDFDFDPGRLPDAASLSELKALLFPASEQELLDPPVLDYEAEDFEGGRYKGFPIIPAEDIRGNLPIAHTTLPRRFYVRSPLGAIGLVPWPGSKVVWPWEAGWVQDLASPQVTSFSRPEPKKKPK